MSLFSAINQSAAALRANQLGLQVVGHNVANANTEGYIRQQLDLEPAAAARLGNLVIGQGVLPRGTRQIIDQALAERMWSAGTAVSGNEILDNAFNELETLVGGLDGEGLDNQLSLFNESLHNLSNAPNDPSGRDQVIVQADGLAGAINQAYADAKEAQDRANVQLPNLVDDLNRMTQRLAELNLEIMTMEGGRKLGSDATGLRDERYQLVEDIARIVDVNVQEQASGSVTLFVGGDYLVSETNAREVYTAFDRENNGLEIRIRETDSPLQTKGGAIDAAMQVRDGVFADYMKELDRVAAGLSEVVNRVHSQGQGLRGWRSLKSTVASDAGVPLERADLDFIPDNGSFDVHVVDDQGAPVSSHRIEVQRLGLVTDSTVSSIVSQIDAIDGIEARVGEDGLIRLDAETSGLGFTFGEDTSGFLAAAGLNTMFTGTTAQSIAVNDQLLESPEMLAISRSGIGQDTDQLAELVDLVRRPSEVLGGQSLDGVVQNYIGASAQKISVQRATSKGASSFYDTLKAQHLSITGVNLDEEAVKMIGYQRAFQASSRVIATAAEMLEILASL